MKKGIIAVIAIAVLAAVIFLPMGERGRESEFRNTPGSRDHSLLSGRYERVALRRASKVAGGPDDPSVDEFLVSSAEFGDQLTWIDGKSCNDWTMSEGDSLPIEIADPNLSDTQVPPNDPPITVGDKLQNKTVVFWCKGRALGMVVKIDERVLVARSRSGLTNIILERRLTEDQIKSFQRELKSMKFYTGEATGVLDEATVTAIGFWSEFKGAAYRFKRPAITENLLDGLGVLVPVSEISNKAAGETLKDRFPDYEPKHSPDTVLDYRPALGATIAALPEVTNENFTQVVFEVSRLHVEALENPGSWEPGQRQLGANETEYVPSDEELLAAELGRRLLTFTEAHTMEEILRDAWRGSMIHPPTLEFALFTFRHVDVMGSGRFFYASEPMLVTLDFGKRIAEEQE